MGKLVLNKMNKNCGNCAYWCGDRELDAFRNRIVVEVGEKGRCSQTMATAFSNASCNKHEPHPVCK